MLFRNGGCRIRTEGTQFRRRWLHKRQKWHSRLDIIEVTVLTMPCPILDEWFVFLIGSHKLRPRTELGNKGLHLRARLPFLIFVSALSLFIHTSILRFPHPTRVVPQ
jgi:hypothetical protein